ncbi:outer membrane protein assembly factor BamA [Marinirhabdus gelatinilytica]|uniref:Outer membrane protein assembly factor BamA n=1 Tax=Marinirhabdus gelatinilytica TaxID=1703343 RepID=A0A370Q770_9FLAO|nr:outer membrane protein assembly factor BamA [Marinirhabdus gelatinilytica]
MFQNLTKVAFILGVALLLASCNAVKYVPDGEFLLTDNTINVDGEEVKKNEPYAYLTQRPNTKFPLLGVPIGLHIYNLADPKPDSTFQAWLDKKPRREERLVKFLSRKQLEALDSSYIKFNQFLQRAGDAPVIVSEDRNEKSVTQLERYYASLGYFNAEASHQVLKDSSKEKRAQVLYDVKKYKPYFIDSIAYNISSPAVDSLFKLSKNESFIKEGEQYNRSNFVNEIDRLTIEFRNSGMYYFDQDYVTFKGDTVNTGHKANITYVIPDRRIPSGDTTYTEPFKIYTVNDVRVVTDYTFANNNKTFTDSITHNGYKLYGYEKIKYRPKAITDALSIAPDSIFSDIDRNLTYNQISDLKIFKYPNISYQEDPQDSLGLIATILLTPQKKYTLDTSFDAYTSALQPFGIGFSTSLLIRNIFRGAETLQLSGGGSVGSSADRNVGFFGTSDIGTNVRLSFPRILFPLNTDKFIPKYMSPSTNLSVGLNLQNNIGLDRQNYSGKFNYRWKPAKIRTNEFDLFDIQYVRNLNVDNYFNVYQSSYERLNELAIATGYDFSNEQMLDSPRLAIPGETDDFLNDVLINQDPDLNVTDEQFDEILSIAERRTRLSENNLIFATAFTWLQDTRENIFDKSWTRFRWKLASAGTILSGIAALTGAEENENGNKEIGGVAYSQYIKGEAEIIKHWTLFDNNVFATRAFIGLAIPYGNANNIPFTRSYFAGGTNDNRGWRAYSLGPGSSGGVFDFNEANFKLAFNAEYRYTILGAFKGAFFVDVGNIWNVADELSDNPEYNFDGLQDLKELAVASGFGIRYDFGFFVLRFDIGFKTHDPGRPEGQRWFKDYNFKNAVYNIGINYPF